LATYDIRSPRRLRATRHVIRGYAAGGQKSVYECFLSQGEKTRLSSQIEKILNREEDSFMLLRLDPRASVITLGIAAPPENPDFFYCG